MAGGTVVGEVQLHMGRVFAIRKILGVTGVAIGRRTLKYIVQMTGGAGQGCMRPG
jgi:hypothetical protein